MRRSYADFLRQLRAALLRDGCGLPHRVREDILEGRILEEPLNAFVVRVRGNASSVTQEHIDALKKSGLDEDQIFEATLCAAYRAGAERYEAAISALRGAR